MYKILARLTFSDQKFSVVRVVVVVNFSHLRFSPPESRSQFQTWHKASLAKGNSSLFNKGHALSPRGDNNEMAKIY